VTFLDLGNKSTVSVRNQVWKNLHLLSDKDPICFH